MASGDPYFDRTTEYLEEFFDRLRFRKWIEVWTEIGLRVAGQHWTQNLPRLAKPGTKFSGRDFQFPLWDQ